LSYTEEFGLEELLDKSQDILAKESVAEEKKMVQRFLETLAKEEAKTAYGKEHVRKVLEMGVVDVLFLSEALDEPTIEEFTAIAERYSTNVMIVSIDTREGEQLKELGKIAAILRYAIHQ
jgi:stalled ribosome rescue protein Dom34